MEPSDHKKKTKTLGGTQVNKNKCGRTTCAQKKTKLREEPRLTKTNVGGTHVNNRKHNYGWNPVNAQIN